jgi:hypothetical protein
MGLDLDGHVRLAAAQRHPAGQPHLAHARDRLRLADQRVEEAQARGGAVRGKGQQDGRPHDLIGVESRPHRMQTKEAPRHQPRRGDEHDTERNLRDHERVARFFV